MNFKDTFAKYNIYFIILGLFVFIDVVAPLFLNLLGVDIRYFIVYLLWANALLLTYLFLPKDVGTLFL
jgi:hypothetical protein